VRAHRSYDRALRSDFRLAAGSSSHRGSREDLSLSAEVFSWGSRYSGDDSPDRAIHGRRAERHVSRTIDGRSPQVTERDSRTSRQHEHELCWHHPQLWGLLPERTDPQPTVPEWPVFLRGCIRYRQSLDDQLPNAPRTSAPYDLWRERRVACQLKLTRITSVSESWCRRRESNPHGR
jgi:hypothetical protein